MEGQAPARDRGAGLPRGRPGEDAARAHRRDKRGAARPSTRADRDGKRGDARRASPAGLDPYEGGIMVATPR